VSHAPLRVVYRLKDDKDHIDKVQKATLTTKEFGIEQTHGLFGSPQWWTKISSGELPIHTASGIITRRYMGSMNDWPEFAMRSDSGEESSWSRFGHSGADDRYYQPGRRIEIDYVMQRSRAKLSYDEPDRKVVLEVRIEAPSETIRERVIRQRATGIW
jgi:hypothetical protein